MYADTDMNLVSLSLLRIIDAELGLNGLGTLDRGNHGGEVD